MKQGRPESLAVRVIQAFVIAILALSLFLALVATLGYLASAF